MGKEICNINVRLVLEEKPCRFFFMQSCIVKREVYVNGERVRSDKLAENIVFQHEARNTELLKGIEWCLNGRPGNTIDADYAIELSKEVQKTIRPKLRSRRMLRSWIALISFLLSLTTFIIATNL